MPQGGLGPGLVQYQYQSGLGIDCLAHYPFPDLDKVRDMMRRVKVVGSNFRNHNATQQQFKSGLGTILLCAGGDWDPITDFFQAAGMSSIVYRLR